jgi:hypothetical protein
MSRSLPGSPPGSPPGDRARTRRLALAAATLVVSSIGLSSALTGALFTDQATVASNTFVTGTVDLSTTPASAAVAMAGMAPGDVVVAPLQVTNAGSLQLRYALRSTSDAADADTLAAALQMTVKTGVTACTPAGFGADGTAVYGPGVLGSTAGTAVFGSSLPGVQGGERVLNGGTNEVLCVRVELPLGATTTLSGRTTEATFTFDAEQTANN